jgi:hypothetical protein
MKTRDYDIHELNQVYKTGKPTERKEAAKSLERIYRESSKKVLNTREKLIDATRSGDHNAMRRYNNELQELRYGK